MRETRYACYQAMKRYRNFNGNSGVSGFEVGDDFIIVEFGNKTAYRYDYASAGKENVEKMKVLAASGKGLSTFISRHVKDKYASLVTDNK